MNNVYSVLYETFKLEYIDHRSDLEKYFCDLINIQNDLSIIILKIFEENNQSTENLCSIDKLVNFYINDSLSKEFKTIVFDALTRRNFNFDNLIFV